MECGGGVARIAFFAILGPRLGDFTTPPRRFPGLHAHRLGWYMFGAWRPKLSGMRRWVGSYCVFRRIGPRKRDLTTTPRRLPVLTRSPSRLICVWCVETQAEWDAAVGCLALRFRQTGPRKRDFTTTPRRLPYFDKITIKIDMCLIRGDPC